jgi:LCP family protein required for cell wall assembly
MKKILRGPLFLGLLIGILVVGIISGVFYLYRWWNTPLGAPLDLSTSTPQKESQVVEEVTLTPEPASTDVKATPSPTPTAVPTFTPSPTVSPEPEPLCGGPHSMIIQVTGVNAPDYSTGLADAIRIVRVDFIHGKISVLPLPRDLWVDIPVSIPGRSQGITPGKLSQAYLYGSEGMIYYDEEDQSPGLLAKTLKANFDLQVDRYVSIHTKAFREIVDQLGGITVTLPQNVYGHRLKEPVVYMKAGTHHLNGEQAEMIARQRKLIGDFGRMENQTILLKALAKKILSPQGLKELPKLIEIYQEHVFMDLTPNEINKLVCLASKIDWEEDITFATFPKEMVHGEMIYDEVWEYKASALTYDQSEMCLLLAAFQVGIWP